MTTHSMEPDAGPGLSIFEKSCLYCGARFRVMAARYAGDERHESYACPECGKEYETEASLAPEVHLLRPRSDGKHDRYQETMF